MTKEEQFGILNNSNSVILMSMMMMVALYLLLTGGFSAPEWSVRSRDPFTEPQSNVHPTNDEACAITTTTTATTTVTTTSTSTTTGFRSIIAIRKQSNVFDNRDLCRIISMYIPRR